MDLRNYIVGEFATAVLAGATLVSGITLGAMYGLEKIGFGETPENPTATQSETASAPGAIDTSYLDVKSPQRPTPGPSM